MFASKVTSKVTIGDVVVTISKLSGKALAEAADVQHERVVLSALRLTQQAGPQMQEALAARAEEKRAEQERAEAGQAAATVDADAVREQRYRQYDRATVLRAGVRAWVSVSASDEKLPPVSTGIDDLDDDAAEQLRRAILDLTLPPVDAESLETERKNG
jgi:hypothetical protein